MSEKSETKRDGARAQKNSGRGSHAKGDAILDIFTIDYKEYPKGFTVNLNNWAKVCTDAMKNRNEPALKIVLGEDDNKVRIVAVAEHIFKDYIRLRELEEQWLSTR